MNEEINEVTPQKSNRRTMMIGGVSAVLLGCCALLAVLVIVLVVDPFNLNIVSRLTGRYDAAATAMPPETAIYVGVNLLNLNPADISRITQPFIEAFDDPDVEDVQGVQDEIAEEVLSEFGITIETDVVPWIGQYIGIGITEFTFDPFGSIDSLNWIVAAEARNRSAADEFVLKLRDELADSSGVNISEQSYEGVTLYVTEGARLDEPVAFGRSGGLVIIASNLVTIQAAIDAQKGDSLDETDNYRQVIGDLPGGRALTVYSTGDGVRDSVKSIQSAGEVPVDPSILPLASFASSATSFSIVEAGIQINTISIFDQEQLSTTQLALQEAMSQPTDVATFLPDQTVAYLSGQRLDLLWLAIREATGDEAAFDESMESFSQEFGLNPSEELFPLLNGEWAIAVIGGQSGMLSEELNVPLGLALVVETERPSDMADTVEAIRVGIDDQLLVVDEMETSGLSGYEVRLGFGLPTAFSFGLEKNYFYLSSSSDTAVEIFSDGSKLAESERYQSIQSEFSGDINLSFYLDLTTLFGTLREGQTGFALENFNDSVRRLEPIQAIALGNAYDDSIRRTQVIIFIDPE